MSGDIIAVLGVGVTLLAAILTFGFALLGAHRATQATLNGRMDRVDQRFDRMDQRFDGMDQRFDRVDATLSDLRRDVTDIDRLSRIEGAVLGAVAPGAAHRAGAGIGSAPATRAGGRRRQPPAVDRKRVRKSASDNAGAGKRHGAVGRDEDQRLGGAPRRLQRRHQRAHQLVVARHAVVVLGEIGA